MDYYLQVNDEQKGPYALSQIQSMWNSGAITSDSLYWDATDEQWKSINELVDQEPLATPLPPPAIANAPRAQESEQRWATVETKSEFLGEGCIWQGVGIILCFIWFPFGILAGIILLVYGGRMAKGFVCSLCKAKIEKGAHVCPHCNAELNVKW